MKDVSWAASSIHGGRGHRSPGSSSCSGGQVSALCEAGSCDGLYQRLVRNRTTPHAGCHHPTGRRPETSVDYRRRSSKPGSSTASPDSLARTCRPRSNGEFHSQALSQLPGCQLAFARRNVPRPAARSHRWKLLRSGQVGEGPRHYAAIVTLSNAAFSGSYLPPVVGLRRSSRWTLSGLWPLRM